MKIIEGACFFACSNRSRTRDAPTPTNISTKSDPEMEKNGIDAIAVYGDEYRKENLRYVCNFWPIFERGICVIPRCGEAVLAGAPEGENYAREMSVLKNYCNVKEFVIEISLHSSLLISCASFDKSVYSVHL